MDTYLFKAIGLKTRQIFITKLETENPEEKLDTADTRRRIFITAYFSVTKNWKRKCKHILKSMHDGGYS